MSLSNKALDIIVWDVQHGNATYINTPNGTNVIIDLGIGSYGNSNIHFRPLLHLRKKWNLRYIDLLIITHPDLDHIQDILNIDFENIIVGCLVIPNSITIEDINEKIKKSSNDQQKSIFNRYKYLMESFTDPVSKDRNPLNPYNNGGVDIKVYGPEPNINTNKANNFSLVTIISYASSKIIIPGDNEELSWKWLLDKEEFKKDITNTDIFLASHHGRKNGYYNELFDYISPKLVIISDGHVCDTSATDRYINKCEGWKAYYHNGGSVNRKCLTTRNDGYIHLKMGYNVSNDPFLMANI